MSVFTRLEDGHRRVGNFILATRRDLETPSEGRMVKGPRFWVATSDGECVFRSSIPYVDYCNPMCNSDERIATRLLETLGGDGDLSGMGLRVMELPLTFVPHDCHDYE